MIARVEFNNVSVIFQTERRERVTPLRDVTLAIGTNEFVSVVGPSGCGKSTLLKLIAGLVMPTSGTVLFNGSPVRTPRPDVGLMFQDPVLLPWLSALDNVLLPIRLAGRNVSTELNFAHQLLASVGLSGAEHRKPYELSGGMRQRVAMCRALIYRPSTLLMDEPFAALDALTRDELSHELLRIWSMDKKTVVFVTHSISEAILLADRVLVMSPHPGTIAAEFRVDLDRPRVRGMRFSEPFKLLVEQIEGIIYGTKRWLSDGQAAGEEGPSSQDWRPKPDLYNIE